MTHGRSQGRRDDEMGEVLARALIQQITEAAGPGPTRALLLAVGLQESICEPADFKALLQFVADHRLW
eukprot:SAG31_NODE_2217_length_6168_cov_10.730598_3_plen_68_part_00